MRDPDGSLSFESVRVVRHLRKEIADSDFLRSALATRWVKEGMLIPFVLEDERTVVSPRLPFVSLPFEWCNSQAFDAALLTSRLQTQAVDASFDLKDASAWNVIFDGASPVFCDLLSFEPLASRLWWAGGQFSRHFLLPLLLAKQGRLQFFQSFKVWRDGVPPEAARALVGPARFLTRYWPLMAGSGARETPVDLPAHSGDVPEQDVQGLKRHRVALQASFDWMLAGLRPAARLQSGEWQSYESRRDHYVDASLDEKRTRLDAWLASTKPEWVLDLGCNAGEFSLMARRHGATVVAVDADHDSVERLYRRLDGSRGIHPVVAPLDDLCGGRGWDGSEFAGLAERLEGRFDLVMMLALVHHLMVGAAIPVVMIAKFLRRCSRDRAVVEFIDVSDVQLQRLCRQRRRRPEDFGIDMQRAAFVEAGFVVESEIKLSGTHRTLALLRRT